MWCWPFATAVTAAPAQSGIGYEHRAWTPVDGAPSGVRSIAQTDDGLLWFATAEGLYRFDGEKFSRVDQVYGHALKSNILNLVRSLGDGLVVAYQFGGLSIIRHDRSTFYDSRNGLPQGTIRQVLQTSDGQIYAATSAGLATLDDGTWHILADQNLARGKVYDLKEDSAGTLWTSIGTKLFARPRSSMQFSYVMEVADDSALELVQGKLIVTTPELARVQLESGQKNQLKDRIASPYDSVFDGPNATVWAWFSDKRGMVRLTSSQNGQWVTAQSYDAARADKSAVISTLLDREDNLWIGTFGGVERYRMQRIREYPTQNNLYSHLVHQGLGKSMVVASLGGGGIRRITDSGYVKQWDLQDIAAIWRENDDSLWAGSRARLYHLTSRGVEQWPLPAGLPASSTVQSIAVDAKSNVWVSITRAGLYRFRDGLWTRVDTSVMGADAIPIIAYAGYSGRVWFGYTENRLGELVDGVMRRIPIDEASGIGNVQSLLEIDGKLLAGGEKGIVWINARGNKALLPEHVKMFRGVTGMALDQQRNLWAHSVDGIYQIEQAELNKFWSHPLQKLKWESFSVTDGVRGVASQVGPLPTLAVAPDGRIFYATANQVGWIDPLAIRRNRRAPDVLILNLRHGDVELEPKGDISLPAGTTALDIRYAVTAMSIPENVKIKYKLSGVDQAWREGAGERLARYTNLYPGSYSFQVIAANEDGVWNMEGARLNFEILPMVWQTVWFRLIAALLLVLVLIAFHRWRLRTVAARSAERNATRLEERERIARSLHDDLLQGVYALILKCATILTRLPKDSQEERILESALSQAEKLVASTRDEVMALRDGQSATQIIAELHDDIKMYEPTRGGRLKLLVSRKMVRLRPDITREICQVFKEAVINALTHSGATHIVATIMITDTLLEVSVTDNGVGIAPDVMRSGLAGHWGIVGMRERLARLGSVLVIERNADGGTTLGFVLDIGDSYN
ncbi:sensor histidine kinase [Janthinobacterium aquaticum]|uniref:sensor histidine kinase n=1 Tax=Janthinobacterium sp. FT58W TaxID=2654254 RepID=UPI0012652842|nr:sensor histidine kinase [Janthinobacterium sp. FT58W]KAB8044250.1 hypothetical protein GCM43_03295 [Janthinobacterium sp. FT58W]